MRLLIPVVAGTLATASALGSRLLDVALLSIPSRPSAPAWTRGFACMLRVHGRARHGREARRRARQAGVDRVRSCSARAGGCPCSVREQPPSRAESNQERAGSTPRFSEVIGAFRLVSPYFSGLKTGEATGPLPSPSMELRNLRPSSRTLQPLTCLDCRCSVRVSGAGRFRTGPLTQPQATRWAAARSPHP